MVANQIFERFLRGETLASESIEMTEAILKRHPELHPKYDPLLAMTFQAQSNAAKAIEYSLFVIISQIHCHSRIPSPLPKTGRPEFKSPFLSEIH